MIRPCAACLVASLATSAIAAGAGTTRMDRAIQHIPPPVMVRGEPPATTSLAARMAELHVPGVSIAVFHQGRIEWARGFGVTQWDGPPITDRTLFQAASISKPVFALAVLRLADVGKVNLDTNVNDYLTSWKIPASEFTRKSPVTLRGLLSHTAGITGQGFRGYEAGAPLPDMGQMLAGAPPANNSAIRIDITPGERVRYTGGGYLVAQAAVQDQMAQPMAQFLRESLLAPLGMKLSTFEQPLPASRAAEIALPHRADGLPVAGGPRVYPELAAAGLWTTPSDLARFALGVRAAVRGRPKAIVSASMVRSMLTPVEGDQGLGPRIGGSTARKFFTHNGGNEGYRCLLVAYEDGDGAVVMTNSDNGGVIMEEVMRSIAFAYAWPDFAPATRRLAAVKPEQLALLTGAYEFDDGSIYILRRHAGRLEGLTVGEAPLALVASSARELFARTVDLVLRFDETGTAMTMRHRLGETERRAVRTTEARSRQLFAWLDSTEQRYREQTPDPRGAASIRAVIAGITAGTPNYRDMRPALVESIGQQLPALRSWFDWLGDLESLTFQRADANGRDEYRGDFPHGPLRIFIRLNQDGRIESVEFMPG